MEEIKLLMILILLAVSNNLTADTNTNSTAVPNANSTGAPNTNSTTSATTTPASTDPPSPSEGSQNLQFSLNQNFAPDLSDQSSKGFKTLAAAVVLQVNRVFSNTTGFLHSLVNSFKSGSVITNMTLVFANKSVVPNTSTILSTFTNSNTTLNIVPGSITVSPNSGGAPRLTVFSLLISPVTFAMLLTLD
ncbi:hypothetical protein DPEC_G00180400 [Dallia pectoralis]|uniref:Uncharacterized protein n=1 Tax=Dallia pectoralis TaxID=75939 RepID=A0ACC2GA99_DALPE|nr:hypothetical protein DPEC_G00180400 [Dallia pectoralis]